MDYCTINVMTKDQFKFVGWCHEGKHDKLWGIIKLIQIDVWEAKYLIFWGKRGAKFQTKVQLIDHYKLNQLIASKNAKGYDSVLQENLNEVYPEFKTDIEKAVTWAILNQ